jgi:hypothetical protein
MTIAVVWAEGNGLWAVADTRISKNASNPVAQVLTDHGPKIFILPVTIKQPGASGFFDCVRFTTTLGFAFAGSVPPALATHALCSAVFQSLISMPSKPLPTLAEVVEFVRKAADRYMGEWGQLSPSSADFSALIFGACPASGILQVFQIFPKSGCIPRVVATKSDLSEPVVIGSGTKAFRHCLVDLKAKGDEFGRSARLPLLAVERMISGGAVTDVGGAIQLARTDQMGVVLYSRVSPVVHGEPLAQMTFLGIDVQELQPIGTCYVGMPAIA